jgi:hypothetical protein
LRIFLTDDSKMNVPGQTGPGAVGIAEEERAVFGLVDEIVESSQAGGIQTVGHDGKRNVNHVSIVHGFDEIRIHFAGLPEINQRPTSSFLEPVEPGDRRG